MHISDLVVSLPGKTCVAFLLLFFKIFKVASNRMWTCRRFKNVLHDTVLHTDALCQISRSWLVWFQRKMWQKLSCEQICLCPQYSKSRKTGSGHTADSKMRYTIQFSILMLCAKYHEAGLCGSREKCDKFFVTTTTQDDRSDPCISPPLKRAGDTNMEHIKHVQ